MDDFIAFIAHDWCGTHGQYGRFTHIPSGETLVCQAWYSQKRWDEEQLEWFRQWPVDLVVYKCQQAYVKTNETYGSVGEIIERLKMKM